MKRLQCDICGSSDIKKVDDTLYTCCSCGIQYAKEDLQKLLVELTGNVKIDRSEERENLLERAQQFYNQGEYNKAEEYYNKVLDLDPNNKAASDAIVALRKSAKEKAAAEQKENAAAAIRIVRHNITPEEGLRHFLQSFKKLNDVAPDIYQEVTVLSTQAAYFPFVFLDMKVDGTYQGVACYRKQIPYTDYETRTDYTRKDSNGRYLTHQVAVTKYREEIDRRPVSGSFVTGSSVVHSVSKQFGSLFTNADPSQYDKILKNDLAYDNTLQKHLYRSRYNDAILKELEDYIAQNYDSLSHAASALSFNQFNQLNGLTVDITPPDDKWNTRGTVLLKASVNDAARGEAHSRIPGDFKENVNWHWVQRSFHTETLFVPILLIEYAYRGKFYIASVCLLESNNTVIASYPSSTDIAAVKKDCAEKLAAVKATNGLKAVATAQNGLQTTALIFDALWAVGLVTAFWEGIVKSSDYAIIGLVFAAIGVPFAILFHILWHIKHSAMVKKARTDGAIRLSELETHHSQAIQKGYLAFMEAYNNGCNIDQAAEAAKKASSYRTDATTVQGRVAKLFNAHNDQVCISHNSAVHVDQNGDPILPGQIYNVILASPGKDMATICKLIREQTGLGLASAKKLAETPQSAIKIGISANEATKMAEQLRLTGASVHIIKQE